MSKNKIIGLGMITLIITAISHQAALGANPHVQFNFTPHTVIFNQEGAVGHFQSQSPVELTIGSHATWHIYCISSDVQGPAGNAIPAANIFALPARWPENPGQSYAGAPLSLGMHTLMAQGKDTRRQIIPANSLLFNVTIPALSPPGDYQGQIRFYLNGKGKGVYLDSLTYRFHHDSHVSITMDPDEMDFGSLVPGIHTALSPIAMNVESNVEGVRFTISLQALQHEDGPEVVPTSHLCLAGASSPASAMQRAKQTDFGSYSFDWTCPSGNSTLFIFGRADIDINMIPGRYRGIINVDYQMPGAY